MIGSIETQKQKPLRPRRRSMTGLALLVALSLAGWAGAASALNLTLSTPVVSLNPGNGSDSTGNNGSTTVLGTPSGGGNLLGGCVVNAPGGSPFTPCSLSASAGTLTSNVWRGSNSNGTKTLTNDYRVSFDITATDGITYDLTITHDLVGNLVTYSSEGDGCSVCRATVSDVTATAVSSGGVAPGGALTQNTDYTLSTEGTHRVDIGAATIVLTGLVGSQSIAFDFAWTSSGRGEKIDGGWFGPDDNEDGGASWGIAVPTPGAPSPTAGDGHTVGIALNVTAVPEPSTALLIGLGLGGLAWRRQR